MSTPDQQPWTTLQEKILGYQVSQATYVAAKLGLADLLKDGPKTIQELAELSGAHPASLYRTLRLLASEGIFAEDAMGSFMLTPPAALLQMDVPGSLRARAIWSGEERYQAWGNLLYSVQTGKSAFEHTFGLPFYGYLAQHPATAATFNATMVGETIQQLQPVVSAYDFSRLTRVVDVGGGYGALITTILQAHPQLRGVLFDRPAVTDGARAHLAAAGVADRCEVLAGDFFEAVPAGGDAYIFKYVIYDWDDEHATAILRNCRRVMPSHGKLLVLEMLIPPGNEPFYGKGLDLNMLVLVSGRARTETEYRTLFGTAGFRLTKVIPTASPLTVLEGVPA